MRRGSGRLVISGFIIGIFIFVCLCLVGDGWAGGRGGETGEGCCRVGLSAGLGLAPSPPTVGRSLLFSGTLFPLGLGQSGKRWKKGMEGGREGGGDQRRVPVRERHGKEED
jgi:hypothetical protein